MKKIIKGEVLSARTRLEERVRVVPKSRSRAALAESGGVLNRRTLDASAKADRIITEADREATRIRNEAAQVLAQVEAAHEEARKKGFDEGREAGMAQATELISKCEAMKQEFYATAEPEIISLVMEIAEKVIGRMVHDHREAIVSIVRQAIDSALGDRMTVRINPEDYKKIQPKIKELQEGSDKARRLVFKEDDSISAGGCVVETEVGTIDAQLETQLRAIRKALEI